MFDQSTNDPALEVCFTAWPCEITPAFSADSADAIEYLCPILGPTGTIVLFKAARRLRTAESWTVSLQVLSQLVGGGAAVTGRTAIIKRTLSRLVRFGYARPTTATDLLIRTEIPPLAHRHLDRLPLELQRTAPVA